jgi:CubicO group peptidase (beta-lactamase class C family)
VKKYQIARVVVSAFCCLFMLPAFSSASTKIPTYDNYDSLKQQKALLAYCGEYTVSVTDPRMTKMAIVEYGGALYRHADDSYIKLLPSGTDKFEYEDKSNRHLQFTRNASLEITGVTVNRPDGTWSFVKTSAGTPALPQGTKYEQIDRLVTAYTELNKFNGSVLVAANNRVFYKKAFGWANVEWEVRNQTDTKFRLGSISKQFTAMVVLRLVELGKLKLHEPIITYLPGFPVESGGKITLHHLLTHCSGIPNFTSRPDYGSQIMRNPYTTEAMMKLVAEKPLEFEPGTKFAYSNSGYNLVACIIEKVTGKTFETCLKELILVPLNMNTTGYDHYSEIIKKRASGYARTSLELANADYIDMSVPLGSGALYSTVEDLYLLDQGLKSDVVLTRASRDLLFSRHIAAGSGHYGYGWNVFDSYLGEASHPYPFIEHGGAINGFSSLLSRVPDAGQMVVLLNNTGGAPLSEMRTAIFAILNDRPYDLPKQSLAFKLAGLVKTEGLEKAISKAGQLNHSGSYDVDEGEFNSLGYEFLNRNQTDAAIEFFRLNVNLFPKSSNVYDSLGEAYLKKGEKSLAIYNYKKSVELDPGNENGKNVLKKLTE